MSNHFFLLIFSLRIKALAIIPKGIANCEPRIIGEINFQDKKFLEWLSKYD